MLPLIQKLLVLVLICLRLAMSAHTSLLNLFVQNQNVDQCVFSPVSQKKSVFFIYVILVLTNNFLKLRSFSNTIQMLVSKANFRNLADLPENLAIVLLRKLSMALFALCV